MRVCICICGHAHVHMCGQTFFLFFFLFWKKNDDYDDNDYTILACKDAEVNCRGILSIALLQGNLCRSKWAFSLGPPHRVVIRKKREKKKRKKHRTHTRHGDDDDDARLPADSSSPTHCLSAILSP